MGRVRKYKKIKAIDPFAKKQKAKVENFFDEPPTLFQERQRKKETLLRTVFEDENLVEKQAMRTIMKNALPATGVAAVKKIEEKRENESMKKFKERIRQETRVTLRDELKKLTSTSQKRKQRLKERKLKRKTKGKGTGGADDFNQEDEEEFNEGNEDEIRVPKKLRASDLGGSSEFPTTDSIRFGEVGVKPPDLKRFALPNKKSNETEENKTVDVERKRRLATTAHSLQDASDEVRQGLPGGIIYAGGGGTATADELEALRLKAQAAYRELREKRRAAGGVNSLS